MRDTGSDIRAVIELLWSRKWMVLSFALIGGLVAALIASRQAPTYESESKVLVKPVVLSPSDPTQTIDVNMDTEAELAQSEAVAQLAVVALDTNETAGDLLEDLTVDVATDTEILSFSYQTSDPTEAQERAQAFADAYFQYRRQQVSDESLKRKKELLAQGKALNRQLAALSAKIDVATSQQQASILELQSQSVANLIVANKLAVVSFPADPTVGVLVQPASEPGSPSGPSDVVFVVLGVLLGTALGTVVVLFLERIGDRPRTAAELESRLGAPVLALIPKRRRRRRDRRSSVVNLWNDPKSSTADAFRILRANVLASRRVERAHTLLVTSAQAGEGKTTVAAHLGIALALSGHRVLVVCGALRHPSLHQLFRCPETPGLTDVLTGDTDLAKAVRSSDIDDFLLLPSGGAVDRPLELLGSETMQQLLRKLDGEAEIVLVDGGSVLGAADGLTLAPFVDGVLFVVDADISDGRTVRQARRTIELIGAPIVGGVLNRYSPSEARRASRESEPATTPSPDAA